MHRLKLLQSLCKASIIININDHRSCYLSVKDHLEECDQEDMNELIEAGILSKMIELDSVIEIQFYPLTPIGFYKIYHYDIEMAIDEALRIISKENG